MESETKKDSDRLQFMNEVYLTGRKNKGGHAYNIISLDYENSNEGSHLKKRDDDAKVRAMVRSKNLDNRANQDFNVINGSPRMTNEVPIHPVYNPDGSINQPRCGLRGNGARIM